jgi:hypothetical protein
MRHPLDGSVALAIGCCRVETDRAINSGSGSSAPAGYRFPREVIAVAVRWYVRYGLCYRDVEELLAERGIRVDHRSTGGCRRSRRSSSTRPGQARHASGDRWFVDEARHEAPWVRVGVRDLHRRAVAAGRLKLRAA